LLLTTERLRGVIFYFAGCNTKGMIKENREGKNMKLTLTQTILGAIAAAACCYIQAQVQTTVPWLEEDASGKIIVITVSAGPAIIAAHWIAVLIIALGIGVVINGVLSLWRSKVFSTGGLKRLDEIGLGLGTTIVLTALLVNAWGFPTSFTRVLPDGRVATQFWLVSHYVFMAHLLAGLVFLSGLAILGCGVAGYVKKRRRNDSGLTEANTLPGTSG
jgi:hypothetical protein